jgi:hypothetical protein
LEKHDGAGRIGPADAEPARIIRPRQLQRDKAAAATNPVPAT